MKINLLFLDHIQYDLIKSPVPYLLQKQVAPPLAFKHAAGVSQNHRRGLIAGNDLSIRVNDQKTDRNTFQNILKDDRFNVEPPYTCFPDVFPILSLRSLIQALTNVKRNRSYLISP